MRCSHCGARYAFEESRFGDSSSKQLKCTQCGSVFTVSKRRKIGNHSDTTAKGLEIERVEKELPADGAPDLPPLLPRRRYSVAVILGADAGTIFQISSPRVYIGRGEECDLQLHDSEISRRHAMLEVRADDATVSDLGSTNGTFVDGERVETAPLATHQEFSLGTTTLMFIVTQLDEHPDDGSH